MVTSEVKEGPCAVSAAVDGAAAGKEPVMIVLERVGDGTWVATPEYGGEDADEPASPPTGTVRDDGDVVGNVNKPDSKARRIMLLKFYMACEIVDFRHNVMEFIQDYFNPILDFAVQERRQMAKALLEGLDGRARDMFWLLYDALDYGNEPAENEDPGQQVDGDPDNATAVDGDKDDDGLGFTKKSVSSAGFVDVRHMRRCIKAFFDPYIDVDDEDADRDVDRHFWATFMSATGFVNRLWDVRRITEVYFDTGLDLETRRKTVAAMLSELEETLKARTRAVSTGRFKLDPMF